MKAKAIIPHDISDRIPPSTTSLPSEAEDSSKPICPKLAGQFIKKIISGLKKRASVPGTGGNIEHTANDPYELLYARIWQSGDVVARDGHTARWQRRFAASILDLIASSLPARPGSADTINSSELPSGPSSSTRSTWRRFVKVVFASLECLRERFREEDQHTIYGIILTGLGCKL